MGCNLRLSAGLGLIEQSHSRYPLTADRNARHCAGQADDDGRLDALLDRIQQLTMAANATAAAIGRPTACRSPAAEDPPATAAEHEGWVPIEPERSRRPGSTEGEVEALILKTLNSRAEATGRNLTDHLKLPFRLIDPLLHSMKHDRLVAHKGAAMMNDYVYQLTELGRERAKKFAEHCTYFGSAPVPLAAYIDSVKQQTLTDQHPTEDDLASRVRRLADRQEHADSARTGDQLGPRPVSCSVRRATARRASPSGSRRPSAQYIWIPRSIGIDGEIMRLFDPGMHEEMPLPANEG